MGVFVIISIVHVSLLVYGLGLGQGQSGVAIERISNRVAFFVDHSREILELFSGLMKQEFPIGETPKQATAFINRFMEVKGEFSQSDFRVPGWMYPITTSWSAKIVCFILKKLEEPLL